MHRTAALVLLLLLACSKPPTDPLEARRIALGLEKGELPLEEAMKTMERKGSIELLRKGGGGASEQEEALRIENLLLRATPKQAMGERFDSLLATARRTATAYARGEDGAREKLLASCIACHDQVRKGPREVR